MTGRSIRDPDASDLRDRLPFRAFARQEGAEVGRRAGHRDHAELVHDRAHLVGARPGPSASASCLMIAGGVPAGATSPVNDIDTKSGRPPSIIVGTSGMTGLRVSPVAPSALSLPACCSGMITDGFWNVVSTWPPMMSC